MHKILYSLLFCNAHVDGPGYVWVLLCTCSPVWPGMNPFPSSGSITEILGVISPWSSATKFLGGIVIRRKQPRLSIWVGAHEHLHGFLLRSVVHIARTANGNLKDILPTEPSCYNNKSPFSMPVGLVGLKSNICLQRISVKSW